MTYPDTLSALPTNAVDGTVMATEHANRHNGVAVAVNKLETFNHQEQFASALTSAQILNTTAETSFNVSETLAAGELNRVHTHLLLRAAGNFSTTGTPDLVLRGRLGGQNIGGVLITCPSSVTDYPWMYEAELLVKTIGATGVVIGLGVVAYVGFNTVRSTPEFIVLSSIDLTGTLTLGVAAQWSAASASNKINQQAFRRLITFPTP